MGQAAHELEDLSFEEVLRAVHDTARGRWFLAEFARRNRTADTASILSELKRMQSASEDARMDVLRAELTELSQTILNTKDEISKIKPKNSDNASADRIEAATGELDAIVSATEQATSDILGAAETIQNAIEKLRKAGAEGALCDEVDNEALNILMACSFQDITGQRISKVVNTLRYLEQRVNAMVEIWGAAKPSASGTPSLARDRYNPNDTRPDAHLLHGPASDGTGINQDDIDAMLNQDLSTLPDVPDVEGITAPAKTPAPAKAAAAPAPADPIGIEAAGADASAAIGQDEIDSLFD